MMAWNRDLKYQRGTTVSHQLLCPLPSSHSGGRVPDRNGRRIRDRSLRAIARRYYRAERAADHSQVAISLPPMRDRRQRSGSGNAAGFSPRIFAPAAFPPGKREESPCFQAVPRLRISANVPDHSSSRPSWCGLRSNQHRENSNPSAHRPELILWRTAPHRSAGGSMPVPKRSPPGSLRNGDLNGEPCPVIRNGRK